MVRPGVRCFIEYKGDEFAAPHPNHNKPVEYLISTKTKRKDSCSQPFQLDI